MPSSKVAPGAALALASRDFRLFQGARIASVIGVQILSVSVAWHVYDSTRRALDLGLVGLAQFLPAFVLALPAGHVADRVDRRKIMAACLAAFCVVALALLGTTFVRTTSVLPVYLILVVFGAARGFGAPAGQALMPDTVPREHFTSAVAWSSSVWQLGSILGPAAGGLVYAAGGARLAYGSSAVLFVLGTFSAASIQVVPRQGPPREQPWRAMLAGVKYVVAKRVVLGAISLDLFAVLLGGATALLPIYARDILHVGPSGLGVLRAAPGVGAAAMAFLLAFHPLRSKAGAILFACVGLFGAATVAFGLSTNVTLSVVALVVLGAADLVSVVVRHTVVQFETPPEMRGRVSAVNVLFIGASNELGEFESGVTAALLGTVPAVVVGGIGSVVVVLVWAWLFPELRRVDRLDTGSST